MDSLSYVATSRKELLIQGQAVWLVIKKTGLCVKPQEPNYPGLTTRQLCNYERILELL